MKEYRVYYCLKINKHGYLRDIVVSANNGREAVRKARGIVYDTTKRNAFYCTTKKPVVVVGGLRWRGVTYTRYCAYDNSLW